MEDQIINTLVNSVGAMNIQPAYKRTVEIVEENVNALEKALQMQYEWRNEVLGRKKIALPETDTFMMQRADTWTFKVTVIAKDDECYECEALVFGGTRKLSLHYDRDNMEVFELTLDSVYYKWSDKEGGYWDGTEYPNNVLHWSIK
jgi:hypothetical protein